MLFYRDDTRPELEVVRTRRIGSSRSLRGTSTSLCTTRKVGVSETGFEKVDVVCDREVSIDVSSEGVKEIRRRIFSRVVSLGGSTGINFSYRE